MKLSDDKLHTPIYVKTSPDMELPADEPVYYLLTADELFLCRNHRFYTSSVPAPYWPSELAPHKKFMRMRVPKIPRRMFEQVVGFFDIIARKHGAESIVLFAWDDNENCVQVVVPKQCATVSQGWSGNVYPMDVHYEFPKLPSGWTLIADAHSHADESAYASYTDKQDERHAAGVHIVVGRVLSKEPPELHIEATVDGERFRITDSAMVLGGYRKRCMDVPQEWIDKVTVKPWSSNNQSAYSMESEDAR